MTVKPHLRLKFYEKERQLFGKAYSLYTSDHNAEIIVKKLLRHFAPKLPQKRWMEIRFYGNGGARAFMGWTWGIRFPHNPDFGTICHEVAHLVNYEKYGKFRHDKRLLRTIKQLLDYCEKKSFWHLGTTAIQIEEILGDETS